MKIPEFNLDQRRAIAIFAIAATALAIFFYNSAQGEAVVSYESINSHNQNTQNNQSSDGLRSNQPAQPSEILIYIDVAGKVRNPGVYQLPEGSRVIDALAAAGGAKRGISTSHINLARKLSDGEQIFISNKKVVLRPPVGGRKAIITGKVSINSANKPELDSLPGIGPVLADRIIKYRSANGPFAAIEDLLKVSGIGESIFAKMSARLTL
jgi:competence protein ComEA